ANTDGDAGPDGAVDNGDFAAFFTAFFALPGEPNRLLADVANTDGDPVQDGSVDNGDFTAFFASFFSGCGN
ncbi:MAG: GC-type dockerin domain-anchored protein, partial [Planctomyces sp.]